MKKTLLTFFLFCSISAFTQSWQFNGLTQDSVKYKMNITGNKFEQTEYLTVFIVTDRKLCYNIEDEIQFIFDDSTVVKSSLGKVFALNCIGIFTFSIDTANVTEMQYYCDLIESDRQLKEILLIDKPLNIVQRILFDKQQSLWFKNRLMMAYDKMKIPYN